MGHSDSKSKKEALLKDNNHSNLKYMIFNKDTFVGAVLLEMANILVEDMQKANESLDINVSDEAKIFVKIREDREIISAIIEKYKQNTISNEEFADTIEGVDNLFFYHKFSDTLDYLSAVFQQTKLGEPESLYDLIITIYKGASKGEYSVRTILKKIFHGKDTPNCIDFNSMADRLFRFSIVFLHGVMIRCKNGIRESVWLNLQDEMPFDKIHNLVYGAGPDTVNCENERIKRMVDTAKSLDEMIAKNYFYVENVKRGKYGISQLKKKLIEMDTSLWESLRGVGLTDDATMYLSRWRDWKRAIKRSSFQLFSIIEDYMYESKKYDFKVPNLTRQEYRETLRNKSIGDLILHYTNLYIKAKNANILEENHTIILDLIDLDDFKTLFDNEFRYYKKYGEIM